MGSQLAEHREKDVVVKPSPRGVLDDFSTGLPESIYDDDSANQRDSTGGIWRGSLERSGDKPPGLVDPGTVHLLLSMTQA